MIKEYSKSKDLSKKLSTNFKASEFDCKCSRCDQFLVDEKLVEILQKIRDHFGVSVNVNSGYRCKEHNAEVGGSTSSHHMKGMAADIVVKGVKPEDVAKFAESIGIKRIGLYDSFVHIGSADTKKYWKNSSDNTVDTFGGKPKAETVALTLPVLKRGAKSEAVFGLQALLVGYGYDLGERPLDGSFGKATEAAVKQFQFERDMTATGIVNADTWAELLGI